LLNPEELSKMEDQMKNIKEICEQQNLQIDVTHILEKLQNTLERIEIFDDIDLVYDQIEETYRFRLYDQDKLTIPVDVHMKLMDNQGNDNQVTQLEQL